MKTASLMIAALAFAVSASSAFAQDVSHSGRHAQTHRAIPYNARAQAGDASPGWVYGAPEPFTAAQKRQFQTPTGAEVDGW